MHEAAKRSSLFRAASRLASIATLLLVTACTEAPPGAAGEAPQVALNSERIEQRFGSYGLALLDSPDGLRRANLYSVHDGMRVCRTYAVVRLRDLPADAGDDAFADAHAAILAGASLGATLEAAGWRVTKTSRYVGTLPTLAPAPGWLGLMQVSRTTGLAVHVYDLYIKKKSEVIDYARILEVHHPDYMQPDEVQHLFPVAPRDRLDPAALNAALAVLDAGR